MLKGPKGPKGVEGSESVYPLDLLGRFWTLGALSELPFRELRFFLFPRRSAGIKGWEGPKGVEGSGGGVFTL